MFFSIPASEQVESELPMETFGQFVFLFSGLAMFAASLM
jgi:hypothetical protein